MIRALFRPTNWNLTHWFNAVGLVVVILGTLVIGGWLSSQVRSSIIRESAATTALYLDSFVAPNLQELGSSDVLTPAYFDSLNNLLVHTDLGREIATIKIWDQNGRILFSNSPAMIGKVFPGAEDLKLAWQGKVVAQISNLEDAENVEERQEYLRLLEIYVPVRRSGSHQVIAVAEFYQKVDVLEAEIARAQRQSWLAVGVSMGLVYFLLVGFFGLTRRRLDQQELALKNRVAQLTEVLSQNDELDRRVRRATANVSALNEVVLRRISTELTGGPILDVNASIVSLEQAMQEIEHCRIMNQNSQCNQNLPMVKASLEEAMREMQAITTGLGLPQLEGLSLTGIFTSVVQAHELRTGSKVVLQMKDLPEQASLPLKIAAYRVVQEALNNSFHHAGGLGQEVSAALEGADLLVQISDRGPGFNPAHADTSGEHLGVVGMRERVESLGGSFLLESEAGLGTRISVRFSLQAVEAGV